MIIDHPGVIKYSLEQTEYIASFGGTRHRLRFKILWQNELLRDQSSNGASRRAGVGPLKVRVVDQPQITNDTIYLRGRMRVRDDIDSDFTSASMTSINNLREKILETLKNLAEAPANRDISLRIRKQIQMQLL